MKPKNIIILGTGGNCIDILDTIHDINTAYGRNIYTCLGFLDDDYNKWGKEFYGIKVLGPLYSAHTYQNCYFVNGIGSPNSFLRKHELIKSTNIQIDRFETIIHPTASISKLSNIGRGVVVFQNVTITSNVHIGNHVIILPNAIVSHDDVISDYTCISGGVSISGKVTIGISCYIGTNASIIGSVTIGDRCLIGMGSVVLHNISDNTVVAGNPAKVLRHTITQ